MWSDEGRDSTRRRRRPLGRGRSPDVQYPVTCECGKILEVTAGLAGTTLTCACGRPVSVPSLRAMRAAAESSGTLPSDGGSASPPHPVRAAVLMGCGVLVFAAGVGLFIGNI